MNPIFHPLIRAYIDSEASDGVDRVEAFFATDAVVKDEGKSIQGIAAIKQWKLATKQKYQYTVEPLDSQESADGVILSARLAGNFPGSPVVVTYTFGLQDDKIQTLEIG